MTSLRALSLLALLAAAPMAAALPEGWAPAGAPEGGTVTEVAVSAGRAWAATPASGLFRSDDGGRSWDRVEEAPVVRASGFSIDADWPRGRILALAVDPRDPDTAYVSIPKSVLKTSDGGRTWRPTGLTGGITSIAVAPADSRVVYLSDDRRIWRSANGGATWRLESPLPGFLSSATTALDPRDPLTVFATSANGIFRSTNGGRTWTAGQGLAPFDEIRKVAVDPGDTHLVYAGSRFGKIWRSADRGLHWTQVADFGENFQTTDLEFDPATPGALFLSGTDFPSFEPTTATSGKLLRSLDGGQTWTPALTTEVIHDLDFDPDRPGEALLATEVLGVLRSADSGAAWAASNHGLNATVASQIVPAPQTPGILYAVVRTYRTESATPVSLGLWKSTDGAATWAPANLGLPTQDGLLPEIRDLVADPVRPGVLYAATPAGLFKTADGAATWSRADVGSQVAVPWDVALDPHDPNVVYTVGARSDRRTFAVARSADGGAIWVRRFGVPATSGIYAVVVDLWSPATVFVSSTAGFYRSQDDGVTWARMGQPQLQVERYLTSGLAPGRVSGINSFLLYTSPDEGATWSLVRLSAEDPFSNTVNDLSRSSLTAEDAALYAASRLGVSVLTPGAAAWIPLGGRFWAFSAAADPAVPGRVYAGTRDGRILVFGN